MSAESIREAVALMRERAMDDSWAAVADLLEIVEAGYEDYMPDGNAQSQMQIVSAWADNLATTYIKEQS